MLTLHIPIAGCDLIGAYESLLAKVGQLREMNALPTLVFLKAYESAATLAKHNAPKF